MYLKSPVDDLAVRSLSAALLEAWRGGPLARADDPALQLSSDAQAEAVQNLVWAGLAADGARPSAWKAGASSRTAAVSVAPLPPGGVLQGVIALPPRATVPLAVEAEIAYRLARSVTTVPAAAEVAGCFDALCVAIEVIGSRWREGFAAPERLRLADLQSHHALVLGSWQPLRPIDGDLQPCQVLVDGRAVLDRAGGHACGDPAWVLRGWMEQVLARDGTLEAGDVVTTGSWAGMYPVLPGARAEVRFDGLGVLTLDLPRG